MPLTADDVEYLVTRAENRLKRGWKALIREIQDQNKLADLTAAIRVGDISELLEGVAEAAETFMLDANAGFVAAGQKTARWLDSELVATMRFNFHDDEAVAWMNENMDGFVRGFVEEQQAIAERVITESRARGLNDADIAAEVRASIGMNDVGLDAMNTYRNALTDGNYSRALGRELTDGRYEAAIARARDAGSYFAADRIDDMADAYRDNLVEFRGEGIALREANSATHAGIHEMVEQAVDSGNVPKDDVMRTWYSREDSKVRGSHRHLNRQEVTGDEKYVSGLGNELRYPGDEDAPDEDVCGCRCVEQLSILGSPRLLQNPNASL